MSGSSNYWRQGTDESLGGIRRQRDVALIVQNAELHTGLTSRAKSNPTPFYDRAKGASHDNINVVRTGDILFTVAGLSARIGAMTGGGGGERHNSNKVRAISSLNGQGNKGDNHDELMHSIQFQGIAEQGTHEMGNGTTMFNTIKGGIITLFNNYKVAIEEGDPLEIWAPLPDELSDLKGKHKSQADLNGEVKLVLRPFKPERHRATPKSIYNCLSNPGNDYTGTYRDTCEAYLQSVVEQATIAVRVFAGDDALALAFYNAMRQDRLVNPAMKKALIDALFRRYSAQGPPASLKQGTLSPVQELERMEYESAGKYCAAVGELVHNVNKNVVGRATSSAMPGHAVNVQIYSYSAK